MLLCSNTTLKVFHYVKNIFLYQLLAISLQCVKWNTRALWHIEAPNDRAQGHECLLIYWYGYSRKVWRAWNNICTGDRRTGGSWWIAYYKQNCGGACRERKLQNSEMFWGFSGSAMIWAREAKSRNKWVAKRASNYELQKT